MKHFLLVAMIIIVATHETSAQLSRLTILPDQSVNIAKGSSTFMKTMSIDYAAQMPDKADGQCQKPYNQVYASGKMVIRINGKVSSDKFDELVQSDNPLLLLEPVTESKLLISINSDYKKIKSIESVSIEVKEHAEVGNQPDNRDVSIVDIIFKSWGNDVSQQKFWHLSQCIAVADASGLLVKGAYSELSKTTVALVNTLYNKLDFNAFNGATFSSLVASKFIIVDKNADLTPQSIAHLQQFYYFKDGVYKTNELNDIWQSYVSTPSNTSPGYYEAVNTAKSAYYSTNRHLVTFGADNKAHKDTMINNERYVLMVAWKSAGAFGYIDTNKKPVTLTMNPQLFTNAFFMASQYEMAAFMKRNRMNTWTEEQCRTRLMQLLGLTPNSTNNYMFEVWAREQDFFRPTIDSSFHYSYVPFRLSEDYLYSFAGYASGSFKGQDLLSHYPFSGLGCTWDWNPDNTLHNGVSEFVVRESRTIYIRSFTPTMQYIKYVTSGN